MTIYAVANKKGGVGKSTTSVQLVTGLSLAGRRVWAVDGDDEQTSMHLALTARILADLPGIPSVPLTDGPSMRAQVLLQAGNFDDVVIDVGAKDSGAMRAALSLCDVMVFPFAPRSFDVWAFENTVNLAREMQQVKDFKVLAFLNKADPAGQEADNEASIEYVSQFGFEISKCRLGDRKAFSHASAAGRHISEFKGAPPDARNEMYNLLEDIRAFADRSK